MRRPLKLLLMVADDQRALQLVGELEQGEHRVTWQRPTTADELERTLARGDWQLVISEYSLPGLGAVEALAVLERTGHPLPMVVLADGVSEAQAVAVLEAGAAQCLSRAQLPRLMAVIDRLVAAPNPADADADAQLQVSLSRFAEGLSRDLHRPLSTIAERLDAGLRELTALRPTVKDPQARDRLADVFAPLNDAREASAQAVTLIRDLQALSRPSSHENQAQPRRGKVLVIDDEPMVAYAVERTIARLHEVSVLTDARVALARIMAGERYDVLVCDLMMPELSGEDFYQALKTAVPQQASRIMFLTGGAFTPQARAFLSQTSCRHLEKPFDAVVLTRALQEMMATSPAATAS